MGKRRSLVYATFAVGVALACSAALAGTSTAGEAAAAGACETGDVPVSIEGSAFVPAIATINAGETVCWTNMDPVGHTVTSDSGLFDSGVLGTGEQFRFTFTSPGSYGYTCVLHPGMIGTVNAGGPPPPP